MTLQDSGSLVVGWYFYVAVGCLLEGHLVPILAGFDLNL